MKKFILILFTFFISIFSVFAEENQSILPSQYAIVNSIEYIDEADNTHTKQIVELELLSSPFNKQKVYVENILTGNPYYDIKLKKGLKVVLHVEQDENDEFTFSIADTYRSNILIFLGLIFAGLLIYVGKRKGLFSLVSILITAFLIVYLLSPMILAGINPIFATLLISLFSTAVTMYLVGGFNRKSTSASIGCVLSITVASALSFLTVKLASLNGFSNEHSMFLYSAHPELNFVGIAISTMILATLGAVMDVAMSIASTINEIYDLDNTKTVKELFKSGMNVGRDIIGTMANTLILVYLGSSLPLLLLSSNIDLQKFLNLNQVVTEISAALIGSCAIVICVPITAIVTSELITKIQPKIDLKSIDV